MSIFAADKIRIGFPDLAATFIPLAIGDKRGFFQEEGLQGEFIRMNPAVAFQPLFGEEIDYYTVLGPGAAAAIRGVPVKLVAAYVPIAPTALIAPRYDGKRKVPCGSSSRPVSLLPFRAIALTRQLSSLRATAGLYLCGTF